MAKPSMYKNDKVWPLQMADQTHQFYNHTRPYTNHRFNNFPQSSLVLVRSRLQIHTQNVQKRKPTNWSPENGLWLYHKHTDLHKTKAVPAMYDRSHWCRWSVSHSYDRIAPIAHCMARVYGAHEPIRNNKSIKGQHHTVNAGHGTRDAVYPPRDSFGAPINTCVIYDLHNTVCDGNRVGRRRSGDECGVERGGGSILKGYRARAIIDHCGKYARSKGVDRTRLPAYVPIMCRCSSFWFVGAETKYSVGLVFHVPNDPINT